MGKQNQVYIPLGIALFLLIIGFLGIPIYALIQFIKSRKNKDIVKEKSHWSSWIMTFIVGAFTVLLYFAITASMERNTYILGFGILSSWTWIFWIVYLVLILLIYTFMRRKSVLKNNTSKISKTFTIISWFGTFIFVFLFFYWNVLWPFSN